MGVLYDNGRSASWDSDRRRCADTVYVGGQDGICVYPDWGSEATMERLCALAICRKSIRLRSLGVSVIPIQQSP